MTRSARLLPFDTSFSTTPSDLDFAVDPERDRHGWWKCRYCDLGEGLNAFALPFTPGAEKGRAITHEAMCEMRPDDRPVSDRERRVMGNYLSAWMAPRLAMVDEQIAMASPKAGYRQTRDRDTELANWVTMRAELFAVLTRCGVDDQAMAALPPAPQQSRDEFLAEIRAMTAPPAAA